MQKPPLMKTSCPDATRACMRACVAAVCAEYQWSKKNCSTLQPRMEGTEAAGARVEAVGRSKSRASVVSVLYHALNEAAVWILFQIEHHAVDDRIRVRILNAGVRLHRHRPTSRGRRHMKSSNTQQKAASLQCSN